MNECRRTSSTVSWRFILQANKRTSPKLDQLYFTKLSVTDFKLKASDPMSASWTEYAWRVPGTCIAVLKSPSNCPCGEFVVSFFSIFVIVCIMCYDMIWYGTCCFYTVSPEIDRPRLATLPVSNVVWLFSTSNDYCTWMAVHDTRKKMMSISFYWWWSYLDLFGGVFSGHSVLLLFYRGSDTS